ncbi:hypothetical protein B9479_001629 [Cryptococcus floricola]|uniref:GATA-type domain-containing protein n=1 Tax=Cryptococcus floricola TaxID=2591691 RepID=A0A5D3B1C0_9TREE|nr:hypothetical protein B9479_001629 [Cryptococcus floricola]
MSSIRALLRTSGYNPVALPTLDRPQKVGEDGLEPQDADQLEKDEQADDEGVEGDGQNVDEDVQMEDVSVKQKPSLNLEKEAGPLLDVAESMVLPYSLTQTRHHHLTSLLPLAFTHPPIPSHNKPRAKPLPKGVFMFPTPPPLVHPLPTREYYGPKESGIIGDLSPSATPPPTPTPGPPLAKRKRMAEVIEPPAHEIECIARVNVSFGPMSFPNTELWIGRFVEPRAARTKKERARPGEKKERERKRKEETDRARLAGRTNIPPRSTVGIPPGPSNYHARPPPRPPAAAPRTSASPALIQLVNQAASRHPWLSSLIYKAAGSTANQEELERLGRAVARLSKGEPIDDLAPPGEASAPAAGASKPTSAATPAASSSSAKPPAADAPKPSTSTAEKGKEREKEKEKEKETPTTEKGKEKEKPKTKDDDSDSEVDMKGPKMVGGGPLPTPAPSTAPKATPAPAPPPKTTPAPAPTAAPSVARPPAPSVVRPPGNIPSSSSNAPTVQIPYSVASVPPKPYVQPPPPFLLLAFKEHPTDKFVIPLGTKSFISRVGGDWVTSKPPPGLAQVAASEPKEKVHARKTEAEALQAEAQKKMEAERVPAVEIPYKKRGGPRAAAAKPATPVTPAVAPPPPAEPITTESAPIEPPQPPRPLAPLPSQKPPPGTVLISTIVPADQWEKVKWPELAAGVPWCDEWGKDVAVKKEAEGSEPSAPTPPKKPQLLNLATVDFLPAEGNLRVATIRLGEVDDNLWRRLKSIVEQVEREEMAQLVANGVIPRPPAPAAGQPTLHPSSIATVRAAYKTHKTSIFSSLTPRTRAPRKFLRMRLPSPPPALVDASVDRMAPRSYPISTKPLYHADETDGDQQRVSIIRLTPEIDLGDGLGRKGKKKKAETQVEFEMPVSLEALDERVEAGAKKALGKRGRASGGEGARKEKQKRGVEGGVCEGCAREGIKVWRRGPTGKGTLCNTCGDLFTEGKLKDADLKAPGAMKDILAASAKKGRGRGKEVAEPSGDTTAPVDGVPGPSSSDAPASAAPPATSALPTEAPNSGVAAPATVDGEKAVPPASAPAPSEPAANVGKEGPDVSMSEITPVAAVGDSKEPAKVNQLDQKAEVIGTPTSAAPSHVDASTIKPSSTGDGE